VHEHVGRRALVQQRQQGLNFALAVRPRRRQAPRLLRERHGREGTPEALS
jgi:hypothetical protein